MVSNLKRLSCFLIAASLGLAAPATADSVLNRGNRFEPASLDPARANTTYERAIVADMFEGLVTYAADGKLVPGAAATWQVDLGGLRYSFRLRPGAKWSDGAPITAEDVAFTFRRLLDPKTASPAAYLLYPIKNAAKVNAGALPLTALGVTAVEAELVFIDLEAPTHYFLQLVANPLAAIVPAASVKAGDGWLKPGTMIAGGPFTLQSWLPQDRIVLARNPRFHDASSVKLDTVNYFPTADLTAALTRFKAGELDTQVEFPVGQIDALRESLPKEIRVAPSLLTYYLPLNTANPKLSDARVRRALSLAIDRDVLTEKVLRTGERPAPGFVPPVIGAYKPSSMDFAAMAPDARIAEAKRLLAEAGYGPGNPLKLTYSHSNNQELRRVAVVIAGMWKRVGVDVQLLASEGKVFFANLRQGEYEVGFAAWFADFSDAAGFLSIFESASVGSNYARYHNAEFDALMASAAKEVDATAREALLQKAEQHVLADQPVIPLYFGAAKNLVAQRVSGWQPNALDVHLSRYLSVAR